LATTENPTADISSMAKGRTLKTLALEFLYSEQYSSHQLSRLISSNSCILQGTKIDTEVAKKPFDFRLVRVPMVKKAICSCFGWCKGET